MSYFFLIQINIHCSSNKTESFIGDQEDENKRTLINWQQTQCDGKNSHWLSAMYTQRKDNVHVAIIFIIIFHFIFMNIFIKKN